MDQKGEMQNSSNEEMGLKVGPIVLMPDIEKRHLATLFFGAFFGIASMAFVNVFNVSQSSSECFFSYCFGQRQSAKSTARMDE